ncbi:hypothetical protein BDK88_2461 [Natrinema hispanicum]|uniref:Uncharacterized protein n=1 Tax=Natrinema hispanicum TaxID=392421 RepID=A0A482Y9P0_9EURY|nr:hypothetical protein BDK88_2461 [Natrinema hispanicum]
MYVMYLFYNYSAFCSRAAVTSDSEGTHTITR